MTKKEIAKIIDHTLLKPATTSQIVTLCAEAKQYGFASVCVNPCHVKLAAKELEGSQIKVCTVIGFPLGENTTKVKVFETKDAIKNGATEIDMVINQSLAKANAWKKVEKEVAAVNLQPFSKTDCCCLQSLRCRRSAVCKNEHWLRQRRSNRRGGEPDGGSCASRGTQGQSERRNTQLRRGKRNGSQWCRPDRSKLRRRNLQVSVPTKREAVGWT